MEISEWIGLEEIFLACQSPWILGSRLPTVAVSAGATPNVWLGPSAVQAAAGLPSHYAI